MRESSWKTSWWILVEQLVDRLSGFDPRLDHEFGVFPSKSVWKCLLGQNFFKIYIETLPATEFDLEETICS